ncbi:MAG: ABC transporter permease [Paludibacteraceae bacterium]|nr:ABC transporter permease [Paludibacteraceae bacterium]MBR1786468.1 ABC transporter permease [Paludibacteraceae bacterium]
MPIYLKELRYFFTTPIAYISIGLYLLVMSLMLWVIPGEWNILDAGYSNLDGLFSLSPWLFMLLCPALTMRSIAEEKQLGTWQVMLVQPYSTQKIVFEKYLASWTVVLLAQLPCLIHYIVVYNLAEPVGNIDSGAFFGSFLGLVFLSLAFCGIGIFCSSLTRSQIISFICAFVGCFILFYGFDLLASLFTAGRLVDLLQNIGFSHHYDAISRGVIDLRDCVYFLSVSALALLSAIKICCRT